MGNAASVKLKEDVKPLEITEQLVRDFQCRIKLVDHSMVAFARTTESLKKTFATIQQCENRENNSNVNDGASGEELVQTPNYIAKLQEIDETLSDHSVLLMDSVSRLLQYIIKTGNICNIVIPDRALLFVEKYESGTFADALEKDLQYYDVIIESMKKKLEKANSRYKDAKDQVENLNKRETLYHGERLILKDEVCAHEIVAAEMKEEIEKIRSGEQQLEVNNAEMKKEIFALESENENMVRKLNSANVKLKTLHEDFTLEKDNHLKNVKRLNQEMADLQKILHEKQSVIVSLETELEVEKHKAVSLQDENSSKIACLEKEKQNINDDYRKLKALSDQDIKRLEEHFKSAKESYAAEGENTLASINKTLIEYEVENRKQLIVHETQHKTIVSNEISKVNAKVDEVAQSISLLGKEVTNMNDTTKEFLTENTRLTSCLVQTQTEEGNYVKAINQMKEEIQHTKGENASLLVKINELEAGKKLLMEKANTMTSREQSYLDMMDTCRSEIETLRQYVEEHFHKSEDLHKTQVASENKQIELIADLMSKCEKRLSSMEDKYASIESSLAEIKIIRPEYREVKEFLMKEKNESVDKMEKIMKSPQKEEEEQCEEVKSLQTKIAELTDENKISKEEIYSLKLRLECALRKRIFVQVLRHPRYNANNIGEDFKRQLQLSLIPENMDLQFLDTTGAYVLRSDFPVLVFCSRSFSMKRDKNITSIVQHFKETKMNRMTALVFFHDKEAKYYKKEEGGMGSYKGNVICNIFDIVHNKLIMDACDENSTNIETLRKFLTDVSQPMQTESAV